MTAWYTMDGPSSQGFNINIGTNQYWRVLASIGDICNICRSSWHPIKNFYRTDKLLNIMASKADLLLFIPILDSLNIKELLNC